jgi:hypothetical protein
MSALRAGVDVVARPIADVQEKLRMSAIVASRDERMSAFRTTFGIACFVWAAIAILSFFKLISLPADVVATGMILIFLTSFVVDALVAKRESAALKRGHVDK